MQSRYDAHPSPHRLEPAPRTRTGARAPTTLGAIYIGRLSTLRRADQTHKTLSG
jgi:hypothetical protein